MAHDDGERVSPWLRHVRPEAFPQASSDATRDALQIRLEGEVARLANALSTRHDALGEDVARAGAANLLVEQMLCLQREHAPQGYRAMLAALAEADPALAGFRADLADAVRARSAKAFWNGVCAGILVGAAVVGGIVAAAA